jgi:hypothetical protein
MHWVWTAMSDELLWSWLGMTGLAIGLTTGVGGALGDYILDRIGRAPSRWDSQERG